MEYEKKQWDIYNSAQNKLKMSPRGLSSSKEFFSAEEKYAIAYFEGTRFYQYHQKIEMNSSKFSQKVKDYLTLCLIQWIFDLRIFLIYQIRQVQ
jgi:hypothetical protein